MSQSAPQSAVQWILWIHFPTGEFDTITHKQRNVLEGSALRFMQLNADVKCYLFKMRFARGKTYTDRAEIRIPDAPTRRLTVETTA